MRKRAQTSATALRGQSKFLRLTNALQKEPNSVNGANGESNVWTQIRLSIHCNETTYCRHPVLCIKASNWFFCLGWVVPSWSLRPFITWQPCNFGQAVLTVHTFSTQNRSLMKSQLQYASVCRVSTLWTLPTHPIIQRWCFAESAGRFKRETVMPCKSSVPWQSTTLNSLWKQPYIFWLECTAASSRLTSGSWPKRQEATD